MAESNEYAMRVLSIVDELQEKKQELSILEVVNEGSNNDYK